MPKTTIKHKHKMHKRNSKRSSNGHSNGLDKIKAALRKATNEFNHMAADKFNQSFENAKEKTEEFQGYLSQRPIKSNVVSLVSGLTAGVCLGYLINKKM